MLLNVMNVKNDKSLYCTAIGSMKELQQSCDNFPTHNLAQRRAVISAVSSEIKETPWQKFKCFFKITFICYQHYVM